MTVGRAPLGRARWVVRPFPTEEAAVVAATRPGVLDEPGWVPARVPGSVVDDLRRAGAIPDPYVDTNSRDAEWAADRAWLYATRLSATPSEEAQAGRLHLRFDGLDFGGVVALDGAVIGRHASMYRPLELDVTRALRRARGDDGANPPQPGAVLGVVIPPAPVSEPQLGRTSAVRVHKPRMTYGWDFCPRLVHQGIWQDAWLVATGGARLLEVAVRTRPVDGTNGDGTSGRGTERSRTDGRDSWVVEVGVDVERTGAEDADLALQVGLRDGDDLIAAASVAVPARATHVAVRLDVPAPRRWWPNGLGEAVVHALDVVLRQAAQVSDRRSLPIGFRTVELHPNAGAPRGARPYTFVVNGRPTFARGWNWVPPDLAYGVPRPDRLAHLLRRARDAGVDVLRVWGGGPIESEAFYDACDRLGILVWQEFSLSSSGFDSTPSDDPAFLEALEADARAVVAARRHHPSLAVWCGGNELEDAVGPLDETRSPALSMLRAVVEDLDPGRPWLPTSPWGPRFANRLDVIAADPDGLHDVHGPWEHQGLRDQQRLYDAGTALLSSEFGVEGMANRRTLEATIGADRRWPPTRRNDVYRHRGDWWINEPLVQSAFGGRLETLDSIRRASQWLQAEGLRYAVEANRRRWPRTSGTIPWQLDEPFPNAWCTSAIDHRGDPKAAYYAVADAYRRLAICASYATTAWGGEDALRATVHAWRSDADPREQPLRGRASGRIVELDGRVAAEASWDVALPADGRAVAVGDLVAPLRDGDVTPVLLDLALDGADGGTACSRVPFSRTADLAPFLDVPCSTLDVECAAEGDRWRVTVRNAGPVAALGLVVGDDRPYDAPGWAEADDGWLHLLPGEQRTIGVEWAAAPARGRRLRIEGWNVEGPGGAIVG